MALALALSTVAIPSVGGSALDSASSVFAWARPTACAVQLGVDKATGVRGLVTTRATAIGEVILEVPLDKVLADADTSAEPLAGTIGAWACGLPPHTQLALVLIRERRLGARSAWAEYLASLPRDGVCLPKDMEPSTLREAQDIGFELEAESSFCAVHEAYDDAIDALTGRDADEEEEGGGWWEGELPSAAEFQWAMSLVWTRCLRLDLGPAAGVRRLLVPCVDMANHEARPSCFFASAHGAGAAAVRLHAARALAAGEAVTLSYGEGSAEHWAQHYGFVPASAQGAWHANPYDSVLLSAAELAPEAAMLAEAGRRAREQGQEEEARSEAEGERWQEGRRWQLRATGVDRSLFAALRCQFAGGAAHEGGTGDVDAAEDGEEAYAERPLPPLHEAQVADAIASACARKLGAYPTSAQQDESLLAAMAADERARLLVQLRLSRKLLLASVGERMKAYAAAQREAFSQADAPASAERGRLVWERLVGEAGEVSAFPELDQLGVDTLQQMTLSSAGGPAMMFALIAGT